MIASVRGTIDSRLPDGMIVAVGGVGLRVFTSGTTLGATGPPGSSVELRTYLHVREDALALYGFATADELHVFELLLTVSGVGPRVALSLLSKFAADDLRNAISRRDADALTRVPGVGRRTADRLIVELSGRVAPASGGSATGAAQSVGGDADVLAALVSLSFTLPDAQEAVRALPADAPLDLAERIKLALRHFQRAR